MVHETCYIKVFLKYENIAFTLNYSTGIFPKCCKVSRAWQLCSTAFLIIEISEFNRLITWLLSFKSYESCQGFSSVQSLSHVRLFATPWIAARQASLSITTPGVYSNSCPSSRWCRPAISSSVVPFSSCPQSFPASGSFPMSQLFAWGGQSIGALASGLPMNIQGWFPLGLTGLILTFQAILKSLLQPYSSKASILWHSAFLMVQLSHPYMTTGKAIASSSFQHFPF